MFGGWVVSERIGRIGWVEIGGVGSVSSSLLFFVFSEGDTATTRCLVHANTFLLVVPIGKSEGDGLTYPTNPRFDADGRWRRRSEWPAELR